MPRSETDWIEMRRREMETVFDLMEDYKLEHPDASDDEAWDAVCAYTIDRIAARMDHIKEQNRERLTSHA